jgi:NADPH-dependent ferric siderophore reductase
MTEHFNENGARRGHDPWIGQRGWLQHRRGQARRMMVAGISSVTDRMRRVSLVSDDLEDFRWSPGQDMVLELPLTTGEAARRHYTIRHYDEAEQRIDVDMVLHGDGASSQWLDRVRTGDKLIAVGPRGHTKLAGDVTRHLFIGDETCIPAIAAMAEHLHPSVRAQALIEVVDEADIQPLHSQADLTLAWLYRKAAPAGSTRLLLDAVQGLQIDRASTQAYVIGETSQVRAVRQHLIAAGLPKGRITAEGYWRPGRVGGHDHVF